MSESDSRWFDKIPTWYKEKYNGKYNFFMYDKWFVESRTEYEEKLKPIINDFYIALWEMGYFTLNINGFDIKIKIAKDQTLINFFVIP